MKKLNLLLFICLLPSSLSAQEKFISKGAATITIDELRDHIYYLASDELEGRLTGTPGFEKAMEYVVTQLRQAGLSSICKTSDSKLSYYQDIPINKYSPGMDNKVVIIKNGTERTFSFEDNFLIVYGMGPFKTKEISGEIAFVGSGIREPDYGIDDYKNIDVKGKWAVIIAPPEELPITIIKKLPLDILQKYQNNLRDKRKIIEQNAKNAGAIGILSIASNSRFNSFKRSATLYHDLYNLPGISLTFFDISLPFIYIDSSMVDYLFKGERYTPFRNQESYKTFVFRNSELKFRKDYNLSTIHTANIVTLIEGSDPILKNEFITLGAHLDHLGIRQNAVMNGADDNASGSAGVLEIAEALSKSQLKRSVICILFTGEELGLLGSFYFTEKPPVTLGNIIANIKIDMIGRPDGISNELSAIGAERINPRLQEIIFNANNKTMQINLDTVNYNNYHNRSDQYPFYLKRIPAVIFSTGEHKDYHTPADDADKIDYEFMQKSCQLVYEIIMELANGDISLKD